MKLQTLFLLAIPLTTPAAQAELHIIPRIAIEHQSYKTEFAEEKYTAPVFGLNLFHSSGFFFDFEFLEFSKEISVNSTDPDTTELEIGVREELAITGGYRFGSGITVFTGYKDTFTSAEANNLGAIDFKTNGLFVGISDSFKLNNKMQLSLSAAMASMVGEVNSDSWNSSSDFDSSNQDGSALGFSTSAAFNISIYEGLICSMGAKFQYYDYSDEIATEEITSIFAKLAYRF